MLILSLKYKSLLVRKFQFHIKDVSYNFIELLDLLASILIYFQKSLAYLRLRWAYNVINYRKLDNCLEDCIFLDKLDSWFFFLLVYELHKEFFDCVFIYVLTTILFENVSLFKDLHDVFKVSFDETSFDVKYNLYSALIKNVDKPEQDSF